ncbi:MAG: sodium:solute symporter family protein, partial [Rickettsiales bacterium]|nr:sodium:solute symporter family protein [Rickettsiales bacterium]
MTKIITHIDVAIVIGYMFFCLVIGLLNYGKIKNIRDYTLGTKPFSTIVLLATVFATAVSARYIGDIGKAYQLGLLFIIPLFFAPISWFILAKLLATNIEIFRKHKFISISEIMHHWYGETGRWVTNVISVFVTIAVTAMSTMAIGYLLHYFLDISENMGMVVGLIIVTIYSTFGGISSVVFTDLFQFLIFFIALPIACFVGYQQSGGITQVWSLLPKTHIEISSGNIPLFISFIFFALIPNIDIPYIQRSLIAKDKKQFLQSFVGVSLLLIPLLLIVSSIGVITYYNNPNLLEFDKTLYFFIDSYLPIGIKGLVIAGLLAMIMSTQDSYLNTVSSLIAHDVCKKMWLSINDKQELLIARTSCIIVSLVSILIILSGKGILEIVWLVDSFLLPLVAAPLIVGLIGMRINKKLFIFPTIISFASVIIARIFTGEFDTRGIAIGMLTSAIVLYILHKKHKGESIFSLPRINVNLLFDNLNKRVLNNSYSIGSLYTVGVVLCINFLVGVFCANLNFFNPLNVSLVVMA